MQRNLAPLLAIGISAALGCGGKPTTPAHGQWHTLTSSGLRARAAGPSDLRSTESTDTLTLGPATRQPLVLELTMSSSEASTPANRQVKTESGLTFRYARETRPGGSGGEEIRLAGALQTPRGVVRVRCHVQSDWPDSDDRCLALITTLSLR